MMRKKNPVKIKPSSPDHKIGNVRNLFCRSGHRLFAFRLHRAGGFVIAFFAGITAILAETMAAGDEEHHHTLESGGQPQFLHHFDFSFSCFCAGTPPAPEKYYTRNLENVKPDLKKTGFPVNYINVHMQQLLINSGKHTGRS